MHFVKKDVWGLAELRIPSKQAVCPLGCCWAQMPHQDVELDQNLVDTSNNYKFQKCYQEAKEIFTEVDMRAKKEFPEELQGGRAGCWNRLWGSV